MQKKKKNTQKFGDAKKKEKKYDKAVVETQVLGVKPPQICKKV